MLQQASSGALPSTWARAAIHDTVAAIVRQAPYRRDLERTLLDRVDRWIGDVLDRIFFGLRGLPHGREIAVLAAGLLVVLIVARVLYARRLRAAVLDESAITGVDRRVSADPWRDAERLASAGQYTEAAHALYRAVVAALAARGAMRPHVSKTSGDYARELRRRGDPAERPFRLFGARYDRIIYGTGICNASDYHTLFDEARAVFDTTPREQVA